MGIVLDDEILHDARGDDATAACAEEAHEGLPEEALAHHEHHHQKAHAEGRAEIGEGYELEFLEIRAETLVACQRDDGGVVAEEGHHGAQRGHAREVEEGPHQRAEDALEHLHHAKLHEDAAYCSRENADAHEIEHRVEQQVVGRVHHGVEHIGKSHRLSDEIKEAKHHRQAYDARIAAERFLPAEDAYQAGGLVVESLECQVHV